MKVKQILKSLLTKKKDHFLSKQSLMALREYGKFEYSYDSEIYALNSFFTVFIERSHYSGVKKILNQFKINYFGEVADGVVVFEGHQPKYLYDLVEFITVNNLWASSEDRKDPDGKRSWKVLEALKASGNKELLEAFKKFSFDEFMIAYGCVADESVEKILKLTPADAGMLAISIIDKAFKKKAKRKRRFKFLGFVSYLIFMIILLQSLFTLFN
ncbi:hypothetical protein N0614_09565 [Pseudomonas aeruginosa]|nr:hypothetical protein [Pseudomonas aeruginosa]